MTIIFIIIKILTTLLLLCFAFGFMIVLMVTNSSLQFLSQKGRKITGRVTGQKLISNKNCNSFPGYHYRIDFEFQRHDSKFEGSYKPWWRYLSKSKSQEVLDDWPIGKHIGVTYDRDDPELNVCELNTWKDLVFSISWILVAFVGIIIIWF